MVQEPFMGGERTSAPPRPEGVKWTRSDQRDGKLFVATKGATKVKVRANVLEVLKMDQVQETCTVILTLKLYFTDPLLKTFARTIIYSNEGQICAVKGIVTGTWGYDDREMIIVETTGEPDIGDWFDPDEVHITREARVEITTTEVLYMQQPDWEKGPYFKPRWTIMNVVEEQAILFHTRELQYCDCSGGHVYEKYKMKAVISERFDLKYFPFDRQLITMRFVAEDGMDKLQFAPLRNDAGDIKHGPKLPHSVPAEWQVREGVPAELRVLQPNEGFVLSRFDVIMCLERKPGFYLVNVPFVLFFITLATAPAYLLEPQEVANRSAVFLAVLFATGGYQLLTASWMPVKPYLTFLNKYILANFIFQIVLMAESSLLVQWFCEAIDDQDTGKFVDSSYNGSYLGRTPPSYGCRDELARIDQIFAIIMYSIWIGWHLLFVIYPRFAFKILMVKVASTDEKKEQSRHVARLDWDTVYKENNVPTDYLKPTSDHPYGRREGGPTLFGRGVAEVGLAPERPALPPLLGESRGKEAGASLLQSSEETAYSNAYRRTCPQLALPPPLSTATSVSSGTSRLHANDDFTYAGEHRCDPERPPLFTESSTTPGAHAHVEVWSRSSGEWCAGRVEGGKVFYTSRGKKCRKSNDSQDVRLPPAV